MGSCNSKSRSEPGFMAEGRVVDTMNNCNFDLPEPIIQRIQSFLTGKEAAQTITLSKSWCKAWLTRPDLDFDESDFPKGKYYEENTEEFLALAKKTIQRYEDSNLKIETFRLFLKSLKNDNYELVNILIVKALKLCASHLSFEVELGPGDPSEFVIAREVFESENLFGLSVKGCGIDIGIDQNVRCYKLESLSLSSVEIKNNAVIYNIISSCPLIQNLSLSNLFKEKRCYSVTINLPMMHNLKCLTLDHVTLDSFLFDDSSSKFPALNFLTLDGLHRSDGKRNLKDEEMQISSRSLERLNLTTSIRTSMFKLDVPSIKKLVIGGCWIPSVSFKSTSKEWESHVSIILTYRHPLYNAWFPALNKLLTALSPSNINLSINGGCDTCFDYEVRDTRGLHKNRVENLNLDIQFLPPLNCYALFDGLFRFCRPKFITHQYQYLDPDLECSSININDFLFKRLKQGTNGVFLSQEDFMYGLHDLKEVYMQFFYDDDDDVVVADLPWKPLIEVEASEISLEPKQKIRFQLVWKS